MKNITDGALRYDAHKEDIALIPPECIEALARVFMYGETKYARNNWRKGMYWSRVYNSAMRHLLAFWKGEDNDSESGQPHLVHAAWNVLTLYWYSLQSELVMLDDRFETVNGKEPPATHTQLQLFND